MNAPILRVFISSTSEDLESYRAAARDIVLEQQWLPDMMEYGTASPEPTIDDCQAKVRQAHAMLLVIAFRRGWVPSVAHGGDGLRSIVAWTLTVNGVGFVAGSVVAFDGAALSTTFVSSTRLIATGNAPVAKPSVRVVVGTPDGELSPPAFVDVTAPQPVAVTISPASATVRIKQTRQFTATVQNTANTSVIWKVNGVTGGNGTVGTISTSGVYRAPNNVPNPAVVTVSATSAADPTKSATASVTVTRH
jgi:Domain of unknown function (DUF4062)